MADPALDVPSLRDRVSPEEWAARVPGPQDQVLTIPYDVFFDEIAASGLARIDQRGQKLDDSPFAVNSAGFVIHGAIHAARHDARDVLHTHTFNGVAVSALRAGVDQALLGEWARSQPELVARSERAAGETARKAWCFTGEMTEIAAAFDDARLPDGFFRAAGEIYASLAGYKDAPDMPSVAEVAKALEGRRPV